MLGFPKTFRVFLVKTDSHTRLILIRCCHSAANEEKADFFSGCILCAICSLSVLLDSIFEKSSASSFALLHFLSSSVSVSVFVRLNPPLSSHSILSRYFDSNHMRLSLQNVNINIYRNTHFDIQIDEFRFLCSSKVHTKLCSMFSLGAARRIL